MELHFFHTHAQGGYCFISNTAFQCGKVVFQLNFYSASGRTVYVWDWVTKVFMMFCDLQILGYIKEYLNKLLWDSMHPFLPGKHILWSSIIVEVDPSRLCATCSKKKTLFWEIVGCFTKSHLDMVRFSLCFDKIP